MTKELVYTEFRLKENSSLFLDLIRALAAQAVVVGHSLSFFDLDKYISPPNFPYIQNLAVLVFFILSGFIITYSTIYKRKTGSYSFRDFFLDRFIRIYIAFLPAIVAVWILDLVNIRMGIYNYSGSFNLKTFFGNLLMLQDYPVFRELHGITSFGSARPFWTIAIEWWIYMLFGYLVLRVFPKRKIHFTDIFFLVLFSIVPVFNIYSGRGNGLTLSWVFGSLAFLFISNFGNTINKKYLLVIIFILLLFCSLRIYQVRRAYDVSLAFLLTVLFYFSIRYFQETEFSLNESLKKFIRFIANYSYSLYLIHYSVVDLVFNYSNNYEKNKILYSVFAILLSNLISILFALGTEMHYKKILKYLKVRIIQKDRFNN